MDRITSATATGGRRQHELGSVGAAGDGPMLLALGGIHGNEPAGVHALLRVLDTIEREDIRLQGSFHAFAGNLAALKGGARFLEEDLNRIWPEGRHHPAPPADPEDGLSPDARQREDLLAALREVVDDVPQDAEVHFLDLHTSSAEGVPFICVGDTLRNRRFARAFPVPVLLGLEEQIDGALLEYLNNRGLVTLGFEGGRHDSPAAVDAMEAAIWTALASAGIVDAADCTHVRDAQALLERSGRGLPPVLEVRYRHPIEEDDGFRMRPGYRNFQVVHAGEELADQLDGAVKSHHRARILLPLYQGKGDDGFFIGRPVNRFWLAASALLRRLRCDRIAHLLPGVRRHPERENSLLVNPHVARWMTVEIFHLLGFRKRRRQGEQLVFSRRLHDLRRPGKLEI